MTKTNNRSNGMSATTTRTHVAQHSRFPLHPPITGMVERITPARAQAMLDKSIGNRKIRDREVEKYSRDMHAGAFQVNGNGLQFDWDGNLLDGHHRLLAIIATGLTVDLFVVRGLDPAAMATIDRGIGRTFADFATYPNANVVGVITRWWAFYEAGANNKVRPSDAELHALVEAHPQILTSATLVQSLKQQRGWPMGQLGFVHAYVQPARVIVADEFVEGIAIGANLERYDPRLMLRNLMISVPRGREVARRHALALVIKAWNAFFRGNPVRQLRWSEGEAFPRIEL